MRTLPRWQQAFLVIVSIALAVMLTALAILKKPNKIPETKEEIDKFVAECASGTVVVTYDRGVLTAVECER